MRLPKVDHGHAWYVRAFFAVVKLGGTAAPDIMKALYYRPGFFGLRFSALHAGLMFVVPASCFALASLNWRRLPARWYPLLPTVGMAVGALALVLVALGVRDGDGLGGLFWLGQALFGLGFGTAFSPLITLALARVPVTQAADASGLLTTMTQLAQVIGVAAFGTLYLSLHPSGHALAVVCALEAVAALFSATVTLSLVRGRSPAPATAPAARQPVGARS